MTRPDVTEKLSKEMAGYRLARWSVNEPTQNCGNCDSMLSDGTCTKVEGYVLRQFWCTLWSAKNYG